MIRENSPVTLGGQVLERNLIRYRQRDGTLHDSFQFANVARPVVREERIGCCRMIRGGRNEQPSHGLLDTPASVATYL